MTQNRILKNMLTSLSDALSKPSMPAILIKNYERQCALYKKLLEENQSEGDLVCGRCLIALSRSLASEETKNDSIQTVKNEVDILKRVFNEGAKPNKKQIESLVKARVEMLSTSPSDEVVDAVLFLYLSLR